MSGDVRFEVERDPVSPTRLVVRTAAGVRQVVRLAVDDQPEHEVVIGPGPAGAFHEAIAGEIPPGPGRARIRMTVPRELPSTPLVLCHVFVVAGGAP